MDIYVDMRKQLIEELERIHTLTYGKEVVNESFLSDLLNKASGDKVSTPKFDDPTKADLVSDNVQEFFNTLKSIDYPIFQQQYGSMSYKKDVETVQIGLLLLGYKLPKHGVDGLFGPETAAAVAQYRKDNNISDKEEGGQIHEAALIEPVPIDTITSQFGEKRSYETHPGVDIAASSGTPVKSPASGVVVTAGETPRCGGTIIIKHDNGFQSGFCHIKSIRVNQGQQVEQGQEIGLSGGASGDPGKGNSHGAHLHFTLRKDGELVNPLNYLGKGGYDFATSQKTTSSSEAVISPNMVSDMINKLEARGVKPEDLNKFIDQAVTTGGSALFTDIDLSTNEGVTKYAQICQRFIENRPPNLLNINGNMMARAAQKVFVGNPHKFVPAELALAQLALEGGIGNRDPRSIPIRTNNPFNVGNTSKSERKYPDVDLGIQAYYNLIANNYLVKGKTAHDLLQNFVNKDNDNYVGNNTGEYEKLLTSIAKQANRISQNIA